MSTNGVTKNGHHAADKQVDLSHHLSLLSRSRHPSPLKDIIKYMFEPGMTSLAGGLPHPSLFPFQSADISAFAADTNLVPSDDNTTPSLVHLHLDRDGPAGTNTLSKAMQYTGGSGDAELSKLCHDFVKTVYKPARDDFEILLNSGNTDAWAKVIQLLCEPGESILVEQFVYPSAQHCFIPMGCVSVPVPIDGDGIIPEELDKILGSWETLNPGVKRPHVLYQVAVGHNPCGATLTWERKQKIYNLAVKYDFIIVEDDPYYWLQLPAYSMPSERAQANGDANKTEYMPSYVKLDTEGRVIRLETFSKTVSPGLRLGFFIASPLFIERLLRATEVQSQAPSGWSQAIVLELLKKWGVDGYLRWLDNLKTSYAVRRDWMCDAIASHFVLKPAKVKADGLTAHVRNKAGDEIPVFSFVPPKAGMFVWAVFHLQQNAGHAKLLQTLAPAEARQQWSHNFWLQLIENKVLLTPGSYYYPWQGPKKAVDLPDSTTYFRLAYSYETKDDILVGIEKFAQVVQASWSEQ